MVKKLTEEEIFAMQPKSTQERFRATEPLFGPNDKPLLWTALPEARAVDSAANLDEAVAKRDYPVDQVMAIEVGRKKRKSSIYTSLFPEKPGAETETKDRARQAFQFSSGTPFERLTEAEKTAIGGIAGYEALRAIPARPKRNLWAWLRGQPEQRRNYSLAEALGWTKDDK